MQPRDFWKIGGLAALLGGFAISFIPRDSAATVRQVIIGRPPHAALLEGNVTVLRANRFMLWDPTGAIQLETCPPWYRLLALRPGERISVFGELAPRSHWRLDHPMFIVHRLRRQDGTEITLRYDQGAPPWQRETWRVGSAVSDQRR